jgi:hypothetical protein
MSSELDFFSACSLKQQSAGRHVAVRVLMLYLYKNASRVVSVTLFFKKPSTLPFPDCYIIYFYTIYNKYKHNNII